MGDTEMAPDSCNTIYLDECGYTGDDLMNADQPVFVIATHDASDDDCSAMKRQFFAGVNAKELKHGKLQGRSRQQEAIVNFVRAFVAQPGRARVSVTHKRYALTAKLVDLVVEPVAHRDGVNLYENGACKGLSTLLFFTLQVERSPTLDTLLTAFQRFVRVRSSTTMEDFYRVLAQKHSLSVVNEALEMVRLPAMRMRPSDILELPPRALDLSFTMALNCVYAWRGAGMSRLRIVHDASTNMARQKGLWDLILSPTAPTARVGYGAEGVQFPIGVEATTFCRSDESDALQLADVVAGAVCRWARWLVQERPVGDRYASALHDVIGEAPDHFFASIFWPIPEMERTPTAAGLGDPLEYLTSLIATVRD